MPKDPSNFPHRPIKDRFAGQVAVVTGAADGIGRCVAQRLAAEGAHVVIFDRDVKRGREVCEDLAANGRLKLGFEEVDVADETSVAHAFETLSQAHERLDIVVNCAGIVGPNARKITEVSAEELDEVYAVNLRGSFLVTQHALKLMLPKNYGRILLFASISGKEGNAGMSAYSSTKAAVIGLAKVVGKEFAETGITVNAIAPAVIRTAMVEAMDPWQVDYMTEKIPMKRCGTLDEVTALACWIVSPEASFNTGAVFDLTGGRATY